VTGGIFAVLYVSIMGLTLFYKTTVFYIYIIKYQQNHNQRPDDFSIEFYEFPENVKL